ncbi:hypothetical protein T01_7415 [Trichinella spiralis]|uniref:Uncharacterized protein n=1 Tax=Trichinella spiralis TaxID=6334 RepID=A0A0V1B2S4_TRISP|nr:hypothetical protein T01_7415 [Trichinella spiralis]
MRGYRDDRFIFENPFELAVKIPISGKRQCNSAKQAAEEKIHLFVGRAPGQENLKEILFLDSDVDCKDKQAMV